MKSPSYRAVEDIRGPDPTLQSCDASAALSRWPAAPQPLKRSRLGLVGEIVLLIFPIIFMDMWSDPFGQARSAHTLFLVLAATAWSFNGRPTSEDGKTLRRAMLFSPTISPLAFAALGGRSMRNIALWKAERGSTMGVRYP